MAVRRSTTHAIVLAMAAVALPGIQPVGATSPAAPARPAHAGVYRYLEAVSAVSSDDIWAVGTRTPRGFLSKDTFVQHWDGTRWRRVFSGQHHARCDLRSIQALAADDIWAVGTRVSHAVDVFTLTEHWNGSSWRRVPSPNRSGSLARDELFAVSGTATDDVWAVGFYNQPVSHRPLVEHWDGSTWVTVDAPQKSSYDELYGVAAVSSDDAWAVGTSSDSDPQETLVEHWNGTRWRLVPSPNRGSHRSALTAVTAISPTDVWAVGYFYRGEGLSRKLPLAEHWDGTRWSVVKTPHPPADQKDTSLTAVSGSSSDDVWAVGNPRTLEHWDGQAWSLVSAPHDEGLSLGGVADVSESDAWAVGLVKEPTGLYDAWHLHWDGASWSSR
jgi:hypothetical protein